tara:strand:+ start:239 stop:724 length:486 start_codon:yes stop_codon:yes gene_type:complete
MKYFLGVDPGYANCGWCIVNREGKRIAGGTIHPKKLGIEQSIHKLFIEEIGNIQIEAASLERYVYYEGKNNASSEQILMVTGAIRYALYSKSIPFDMYRALDWKNKFSRYLFKTRDFKNPSDRLDKAFSLAAAECYTSHSFKTDHEADAACLASMAQLKYE